MGESLATQNAYLSVSNFPIVVLTECGLLSDLERTSIMEQLEDLIDQSERHALIIDLTEGAALPEKQRIYVAEAIQMRAKAIAKQWAGLAVVVGGPEHQRLAKAEFWLGVCPVQGRVFPTLEAATAWAQECLSPTPSGQTAPGAEPSANEVSPVRPTRSGPRPIERNTRSHKGVTTSNSVPSRAPSPTGKVTDKAKPKPTGRVGKLGRLGLVGVSVIIAAALLLWLAPTGEGRLSAAEASEFERLKSGLAMRVYRDAGKGELPLANGDRCAPGDKLGFEVDIPAKGYMLILGVKADSSTYSVFPGRGRTNASRIAMGSKQRLPLRFSVTEAKGKQRLSLVYCPMGFAVTACKVEGGKLACPPDCVTSELTLDTQS